MHYRQNKTLKKKPIDVMSYFQQPLSPRQKHYEAIRAIVIEKLPVEEVAQKFGYKTVTVYSFLRDAKAGKLELFPIVPKGPKSKQTSPDIQDKIIAYRRQRLSCPDIQQRLAEEDIQLSARTVERCLKDAGCGRLKHRTNKELGKTVKNTFISIQSEPLNFSQLEPFNVDCPTVGVFFFIPCIIESGILEIVKQCHLPESSRIGSTQACLSMLLLKLIGRERLSHIGLYDQEPGFGIFTGLTRLPKPTYMSTSSCRCSETQVIELQNQMIRMFTQRYSEFYRSDFINLDFHSIPPYGDESEMEKIWCGARGKAMKGANTVFAQDSQSNAILYTRADILRSEEADEIKKFVNYWRPLQGNVDETLVFDCKFTTDKVLDELSGEDVKFITLRKRCAGLLKETAALPKEAWEHIYLPIPKRKDTRLSVHEQRVKLRDCQHTFRQITIKDPGRSTPTFVLTNKEKLPVKQVLEVYVKRWHVETKLAELVAFFNLNALSSPLMIRIHFDILWTVLADTLYHRVAQDLRRFEKAQAPQLFDKFIDMPGRVVYDGTRFMIKIRKRAHTPILTIVSHFFSA